MPAAPPRAREPTTLPRGFGGIPFAVKGTGGGSRIGMGDDTRRFICVSTWSSMASDDWEEEELGGDEGDRMEVDGGDEVRQKPAGEMT